MDFAPIPSQHFGPPGTAISPFDIRHMSNAFPDFAQHRYVQQLPQAQISQAPAIDPNLAYSPYSQQQFAGQLSGQYPPQHLQQPYPQLQGGYSSNSTNMESNPSDLQSHSPFYLPQQQMDHGMNRPRQSQYPTYAGQQRHYGHMLAIRYQSKMGHGHETPRLQVESPYVSFGTPLHSQRPQVILRNSSDPSLHASTTLRGPPRKPKQSGHALWVGNLPPGAQIADLKDHFSRDATEDIQSVFLISKSHCAFVNYKSEEACAAAKDRFHDARFRGVRLICRLSRGSSSAASPASPRVDDQIAQITSPIANEIEVEESPLVVGETSSASDHPTVPEIIGKEKFFILKSLTVEDLERSVNNGVWATQAHNETNLNFAYRTAEHVYLIFSANKSGEYFGYARMESAIGADAVSAKDAEAVPLPKPSVPSPATEDVPLMIPTSATATAPRGYIIDDSARGTIFWEAEDSSLTPLGLMDGLSGNSGEMSGEGVGQKGSNTQQTPYGQPFKVSWQSTERLPFYRTRGLRNPWNANREVKIARDGTELEATIGRKLVDMFEQQKQVNLAARTAGPPPQYGYVRQMPHYSTTMQQLSYGCPQQGAIYSYGQPHPRIIT